MVQTRNESLSPHHPETNLPMLCVDTDKQMMKALSGKYSNISPKTSTDRGSRDGAAGRITSVKRLGGGGTKGEEADDSTRRSSFPPAEHKPCTSWSPNKTLGRSSLSSATFGSTGIGGIKASPSPRPLSAARSLTPPKGRLDRPTPHDNFSGGI